jgi:hypothetical protein
MWGPDGWLRPQRHPLQFQGRQARHLTRIGSR